MTYKEVPDKWIRKAIFDAYNGITVSGNTVNVFDYRIPVTSAPRAYILINDQTATIEKTKCEYDYQCSIVLEVVVQYEVAGNIGSRLLLDEIVNEIINNFNAPISLAVESGLTVIRQHPQIGVGDTIVLKNFIVYRKPITLTFYVV